VHWGLHDDKEISISSSNFFGKQSYLAQHATFAILKDMQDRRALCSFGGRLHS
jgi:hypothetical protein